MAAFIATYGFLIVSMVLAAILALSLYLPLMAGQLSLASPGFYALGGYIGAILATRVFTGGSGLYPVKWVLLEMAVGGLASGALAVPAFSDQGGPFAGRAGWIEGDTPATPKARAALATLYVALMSAHMLHRLEAPGDLIVEGGFARSPGLAPWYRRECRV